VAAAVFWTRERILQVIEEWADDGGDMRIASYRRWSRDHRAPTDTVIARKFGSWREMVTEAGLAPDDRPGYETTYRRR